MIQDWLKYAERNPNTYVFRLIDVSEKATPGTMIKSYLGEELLKAYRDIEFLKSKFSKSPEQELIDYIKRYVLPSNRNQMSKNVSQGDFGEVLASLIVSYFQNLIVPAKKLRLKINNEKSVFGTDMIAHNGGTVITDMYYYEIKTKIKLNKIYPAKGDPGVHITIVAHNSLLSSESTPNEQIADHLSRHFYEIGDLESSERYFDIVRNPLNYKRNFELFFIIDHDKYIRDILDDLHNLPPSLHPLNVTIVLIKNLGRLIIETRDYAIGEAYKYIKK